MPEVGPESHQEPVFILSPPRGYSTVSLALLAGHPDIYGFPELVLFTADTVAELIDEARRRPFVDPRAAGARITGVCRVLADLHEGGQSDAAVNRAGAWLTERSSWSTARLMEYLLASVHPRIGLEKSPDNALIDSALAACVKAFPKARFIHLTRHPADSQRSMHAHWANHDWSAVPLPEWAANTWYSGHVRIIATLSALPDHQWIRVRSEDLLRSPREVLPRILDWLGIESGASVIERMRRTERWRFADQGESGRLAGADPKFLRSPALRAVPAPGPVDFEPAWNLPAEARRRMTELARYLGY